MSTGQPDPANPSLRVYIQMIVDYFKITIKTNKYSVQSINEKEIHTIHKYKHSNTPRLLYMLTAMAMSVSSGSQPNPCSLTGNKGDH